MKKLINCPDCNGKGGDDVVDIEDYIECPTCEGTGKVEKGTKSWIQRLFESK
jgi:DnaJ-class molecular chaperone